METPELNVVTGAFGYTGKYITRRLLSMGKRVRTLTGHPTRQNPFGDQVPVSIELRQPESCQLLLIKKEKELLDPEFP